MTGKHKVTRRGFLQGSAAGAFAATIVPRNVLGRGQTPPSEEFGGALIGCGGRGGGTFGCLGPGVRRLAECDVKFKDRGDNKTFYTDFRRVLERKDIDVVAIATHPGWHALISIAAMEAGKDVVCEKPMSPIHRRRPRGGRGREALRPHLPDRKQGGLRRRHKVRKIFESGLLKKCDTVLVQRGGMKVKEWSGMVKYQVAGRARQPRLGHVLRTGAAAALSNGIASAARTAATGTTKAAAWPTWPTINCTTSPTSTAAT